MRLLVLTDQWFPDTKGGVARVATDTSRLLAARGHEVTVIAPAHEGCPAAETDGTLTVLRQLRRGRLPQTITDVVDAYRAVRALRGTPVDLLLSHTTTTALGALATRPGSPFAFVFHASPLRELRDARLRGPTRSERLASYLLQPLLALLERVSVPRAQRILLLSEFSRSLVETDHPRLAGRVRLVPGAVDTDWFSPGDGQAPARERLGVAPTRPLLVSARRLDPRMGLEQLLHAVHLLRDRRPVDLVVIGGGQLRSRLEGLVRELDLEEQVRLVGRVSDETLRDWYRAADLFVLPTVAYEGFGMVTAEALATGTPVVGTPVGATPELLGPLEPDLLAKSADPDALADAIVRALDVGGAELRSRCRTYACSRFSWSSAAAAWETALEEAVHAGSSRAAGTGRAAAPPS